jgi:hypothetical protein
VTTGYGSTADEPSKTPAVLARADGVIGIPPKNVEAKSAQESPNTPIAHAEPKLANRVNVALLNRFQSLLRFAADRVDRQLPDSLLSA